MRRLRCDFCGVKPLVPAPELSMGTPLATFRGAKAIGRYSRRLELWLEYESQYPTTPTERLAAQ